MNTDPDVTRAVRSWLREGADRLPERVLDSVLDAVPTTSQRRPWWPAWRFQIMPTAARAGIGAALVAGALIIVAGMLATGGGGSQSAVTASASPTAAATSAAATAAATASPTAAPTAAVTAPPAASPDAEIDSLIDVGRRLSAGSYHVAGPFLAPYEVTLPDKYQVRVLEAGEASFFAESGVVAALVPEAVFADPCTPDLPVAASTVDEFVTALSAMKGFTAEDVRQTTVGGLPATTFLLKNSIDTTAEGCTRHGVLPMFSFPGHPEGASTNGGMDELFYVLDVGGRTVFVVVDGWSSPAGLEELKAIAEGIRFE